MKTIVLGVTGSIAAYKAADLANLLTKKGYDVHVIMTEAATRFLTPLTLQTLTKNKVCTDLFSLDDPEHVEHIHLAQTADLFLVAPATANLIAKAANGIADDLLSSAILAVWKTPVVFCPAMNTAMYENPITQRNIKTLTEAGCFLLSPERQDWLAEMWEKALSPRSIKS